MRRTLCCKIVFYEKKKGSTSMSKDNVISLENPARNTDLLRAGTRELIAKAVQTKRIEFLSQYQTGRKRQEEARLFDHNSCDSI
jgi:hypothetical protein